MARRHSYYRLETNPKIPNPKNFKIRTFSTSNFKSELRTSSTNSPKNLSNFKCILFVLSLIYSICSSTCYLFMSKFLYIAHTPNSLFLKITYRKPKTTTVKKITVLLLSFSIFFLHLEQKCSHFHVYNCVCFIYLYNYFTTPLSGNLW